MPTKYPRPTPRNIIIPLMHIPTGDGPMRAANTAVLGAVTKSINRETRTALQMHRNFSVNPSGICEFEGEMSIPHGTYIANMLSNLRKDANGPIDSLYVTHPMRRCDVVTLGEHWVLMGSGYIKRNQYECETEAFKKYREETQQSAFYAKVALVLTTMHTMHAYYQLVSEYTVGTAYSALVVGGSIDSECSNFKDNTLIMSATYYYPIRITPSSLSLQLNLTSNNTFSYTLNSQIHPDEDKKAIL